MPHLRRNPWRHVAVLVVAAGAILSSGSGVWAQQDDTAEISALIDQLAAPSLAERDEATEELERYEGPLESLIRPMLINGEVTPEQAARIETILKYRFMESPRAALGVGFVAPGQANNRVLHIPVVLDRILAGFPCSKTLKPGDIIRVVDGFELPAVNGGERVRSAILSHLPGEELELIIERDGRRSFVRVPLGDYARLNNPRQARLTPPAATLKAAWKLRKARIGLGSRDAFSPLPLVTDGARSELPSLPERKAPEIWAGGSPDNGAALLHQLRSRASNPPRNNIAATTRKRINIAEPGQQRIAVRAQPIAQSPKARLGQLQKQLVDAIANRERYLRIVARDDIGLEQQRSAIAELTRIEAQVASLKSAIAKFEKANVKQNAPDTKPQD